MTPQEYMNKLKEEYIVLSKDVDAILLYGDYSIANEVAWNIVIKVCEDNNSPQDVIERFKRLKEVACG